jgi:tRNA-Thr(GGU) m(6)t(6)A37 methyltransferase TsaA
MSTTFTLFPIGQVSARDGRFELLIEESTRPALTGLEGFGHINVLWWCDQVDDAKARGVTTTPRPYRGAPETLGIFATRSPVRPNPIAVTSAPVIGVDVEAGKVEVAYIDADDGTPVLDIKPYHPSVDRIRQVQVPAWCSSWPEWYEDSGTFDWGSVFENAR